MVLMPLVRRTESERRAYVDGFAAGGRAAVAYLMREFPHLGVATKTEQHMDAAVALVRSVVAEDQP